MSLVSVVCSAGTD